MIMFCFTEQGDGSGQVLPLAAARVQIDEALHQVTVATPAVSNLTRLAHASDPNEQRNEQITSSVHP